MAESDTRGFGIAFACVVAAGCSAKASRIDDRPWLDDRTCTSVVESVDGNRTETRIERDRFGRLTRFESTRTELFDEWFDGLRRTYRTDGTIAEERLEANTDESARTRIVHRRDEHRRVVRTETEGGVTVHRYDESGRLTESTYLASGSVTTYDRSIANRLEVRSAARGAEPEILELYDLDDAGRILEIRPVPREPTEGPASFVRFERDEHGHVRAVLDFEGGHVVARERCDLDRLGRARRCEWDYLDDGTVDSTTTYSYEREYGAFPCTVDALPSPVRDDRP